MSNRNSGFIVAVVVFKMDIVEDCYFLFPLYVIVFVSIHVIFTFSVVQRHFVVANFVWIVVTVNVALFM